MPLLRDEAHGILHVCSWQWKWPFSSTFVKALFASCPVSLCLNTSIYSIIALSRSLARSLALSLPPSRSLSLSALLVKYGWQRRK